MLEYQYASNINYKKLAQTLCITENAWSYVIKSNFRVLKTGKCRGTLRQYFFCATFSAGNIFSLKKKKKDNEAPRVKAAIKC